MSSDRAIATMPISEVVHLPGGNGLASPPFHMLSGFLGLFGWQHVEQGVEALICEGEIVSRTRFTSDWLKLVGRRRFMRRVLLQPPPLTDVAATALTGDQLELTLTVSIKYTVVDPLYVASLQDPISELENLIMGLVAEYVRSKSFAEIVSDDGTLRSELREHIETSPSTIGRFGVTEVLKALPTGDERIIEVVRGTRIAEAERGLIDETGRNELLAAQYKQQIAIREAELLDKVETRRHEREMEMERVRQDAESKRTLLEATAEVLKSGMDPSVLWPQLEARGPAQGILDRPALEGTAASSGFDSQPSGAMAQINSERAALESLQDLGQIQGFDILGEPGLLEGALVRAPGLEIVMSCGEDYPGEAPEVFVRYDDDTTVEPALIWIPGVSNLLAQAVVAVMQQVEKGRTGETKDLSWDWE